MSIITPIFLFGFIDVIGKEKEIFMDKSFVSEHYEHVHVCATQVTTGVVTGQVIGIRACLNAEGKATYGDIQFEELLRFVKKYKEYSLIKYGSEIEINLSFFTGIVGDFEVPNKYSFD